MSAAQVTREQRHTRQRRCPICDGADGDPRGKGARCSGFTTSDESYAHCSREELAGRIDANGAGLFAHRLAGTCHCGTSHGTGATVRVVDTIEATYPYTDETGRLLFEVVRKSGKQFRQRKPDGAGGWEWKLNGVRRVPYRLRELLEAAADRTVYIVEGEKDVEALERRGHLATTNPGGAGKWSAVASVARTALQGRDVVVIADGDEIGRKHSLEIADSLRAVARSLAVVVPPAPHKDVSDLLLAGGSLDDLVLLQTAIADVTEVETSSTPVILLATPADRVRALAQLGPVVRLESGLPTLDSSCRGGVPTRRLVVVGGAPGAGKTTLATNLLWRWAKTGVPVAMLAVDEGIDGILMRIAQLEGIDLERIEARDPIALEQLAQVVERAPLILIDGDEAAGSVEAAVAQLVARACGADAVLVVDSIQTARAAGSDVAGSPRDRIDCVVRALKAARDKHGLLLIATCELARGSYRSKNTADQINDLAAFKESGSIEYAAQTALVLRSVANESELVDVAVPKNRAYRKEGFRLRLDHRTTALVEVDMPPDSVQPDESARYAAVRRAVVDVVGAQELRSARSILRAVRELGQRCRDADVFDAVKVMQDEGVLRRDGREPFRIDLPHDEGQE